LSRIGRTTPGSVASADAPAAVPDAQNVAR
jgi:hypothetical protein